MGIPLRINAVDSTYIVEHVRGTRIRIKNATSGNSARACLHAKPPRATRPSTPSTKRSTRRKSLRRRATIVLQV
ncbi:unnamed protein product [Trichogramma brassicae]|uniref:Uncharacterized protein n=1 Tax=Trichogramma brassicae TaxID=86971 RepID=A0A6H5IF36_9HYME|nr:unnamed protein product [Trichogramma brassicae]